MPQKESSLKFNPIPFGTQESISNLKDKVKSTVDKVSSKFAPVVDKVTSDVKKIVSDVGNTFLISTIDPLLIHLL